MTSIPNTHGKKQASQISSYKYIFKLQPEDIQNLSRDQLMTLCLELYTLLFLIITIIRNPLAAIATRIVAIDLIITQVEKNVRGALQHITERTPIFISGDKGIAKRLGIHANTISKCLGGLAKYNLIKRDYRFDETTQKDHLDVTVTPTFLERPEKLQDKTQRAKVQKRIKQAAAQSTPQPTTPFQCNSCGSENIHLVCADCGVDNTYSKEQTYVESTLATQSPTPDIPHKICVDTSNNNPPCTGFVENEPSSFTQEESIVVSSNDSAEEAESEQAPTAPPPLSPPPVAEESDLPIFSAWLDKRRGKARVIVATGHIDYDKKYIFKPTLYEPDIRAYLEGRKAHMYGSQLLRSDGKTWVLAFDNDGEVSEAQVRECLHALATAGAAPLYWHRRNTRGHLELYFSDLVSPQDAYAWCISVCPTLTTFEECYPVGNRLNNSLSWPLYQRVEETITPCPVWAMLPTAPGTLIKNRGISQDRTRLARLIQAAITPVSLIPQVQVIATTESADETGKGGALLEKKVEVQSKVEGSAAGKSQADLAKTVIADFNRTHSWEEVAYYCGGLQGDRFCAVWRTQDDSPSVVIDKRDSGFAADYGKRGPGDPFKLDKYEVWCLSQGIDKKADLARRVAEYREGKEQGQKVKPLLSPPSPVEVPPLVQAEPNFDNPVKRLRGSKYVSTSLGVGTLWRLWDDQIGVVLVGQDKVTFFKKPEEIALIFGLGSTLEKGEDLF